MENFFILSLPVYGKIGDGSVWDKSGECPVVLKLDYEFDFNPDSDLFQTFPVFIVSNRLAESLLKAAFSGFEIAAMSITVSETFLKLYPGRRKPLEYSWLKVHGRSQIDDFGMHSESRLVVSKRVLDHLQGYELRDYLKYDAEVPLKPNQIEDDLFDEARKLVRKLQAEREK